MKNRRAIFSAIASTTMLTVAVLACSDDKPSTFVDPKEDAGATFTDGSFNTDSPSTPDACASAVTCSPGLPVTFAPTFVAPVKKVACTDAELGSYYDSCLPKLKEQPCKDWLAAHADCAACIETKDNTGPVQVWRDRYYYTLNNGGCVALVEDKTDQESCGAKYDIASQCRRAACDDCFANSCANFDNFRKCQSDSITTKCSKYQNESSSVCLAAGYQDAGSSLQALDCFAKSKSETEHDVFVRVEKIFCGGK